MCLRRWKSWHATCQATWRWVWQRARFAGEKAAQRATPQPDPDLNPCMCADGGAGVLPAGQLGSGCGRGRGRRGQGCAVYFPSALT